MSRTQYRQSRYDESRSVLFHKSEPLLLLSACGLFDRKGKPSKIYFMHVYCVLMQLTRTGPLTTRYLHIFFRYKFGYFKCRYIDIIKHKDKEMSSIPLMQGFTSGKI